MQSKWSVRVSPPSPCRTKGHNSQKQLISQNSFGFVRANDSFKFASHFKSKLEFATRREFREKQHDSRSVCWVDVFVMFLAIFKSERNYLNVCCFFCLVLLKKRGSSSQQCWVVIENVRRDVEMTSVEFCVKFLEIFEHFRNYFSVGRIYRVLLLGKNTNLFLQHCILVENLGRDEDVTFFSSA